MKFHIEQKQRKRVPGEGKKESGFLGEQDPGTAQKLYSGRSDESVLATTSTAVQRDLAESSVQVNPQV